MNKLLMFIGLIIGLTTSLTWGSSYLLHLKNGNELRTSYYWDEGNEIKFFIYGGVAGIQKGFVAKITSSEWYYKESQTPLILNSPNSNENPQIHTKDTEKDTVIDFDYYRERKISLKEKLEEALERNREAIARKDQQAKELTRKEYLEFSKQIIDLGDELKRKNKGLLPKWWEE